MIFLEIKQMLANREKLVHQMLLSYVSSFIFPNGIVNWSLLISQRLGPLIVRNLSKNVRLS